MESTTETTAKNTWIWWTVSLLGLGAIGTAIWYFFFRKESTFVQNRLKKEANTSGSTSTNVETTTTTTTQPQAQTTTTQVDTPKVQTTNHVDTTPKTPPKEDKPNSTRQVYEDIFLKNRVVPITSSRKNSKALIQYLINDLIENYKVAIPKLVVDGDFGKKSRTAFSIVMNKLYKKTGVIYPVESFTVGMFVAKYAGSKNALFDASENDIKALMGKVDAKKVFLS